MISLMNKKMCSGCGACAQICPKGCITMTPDEEGFLYPIVNQQTCVECGLCDEVCPLQKDIGKNLITNAYVAYAKDNDIRERSSSGGICSLLAERILKNNGVVFGAAFADDFSVQHIAVDNLDDLYKLRGSKYVQSAIGDCYLQARAALEAGKEVLFVGTGCQIAGLRSFLKKEYKNLFAVELLCHGTPSPAVWRRYLQEQEAMLGHEITSVSFRNKSTGWKKFSLRIETVESVCYSRSLDKDDFMRCFLANICLRPACHDCHFKSAGAMPDILLGDAWGVGEWLPEMDDDKGTSLIFTYTPKGNALWLEAAQDALAKEVDPTPLIYGNGAYEHPVKAHPNRKRFFERFNSGAKWEVLVPLTKIPLQYKIANLAKRIVGKVKKLIALADK